MCVYLLKYILETSLYQIIAALVSRIDYVQIHHFFFIIPNFLLVVYINVRVCVCVYLCDTVML